MIILPYSIKSRSAFELAKGLNCKVMKKEGSSYKGKLVINWGSSISPKNPDPYNWLNHPESVSWACNKLTAFENLKFNEVSHLPWTTVKGVAEEWLEEGSKVVVRKILTSHSGKGIVICKKGEELPDAPLYTKYIPKSKEYRVHATPTGIIDVQQKRRKNGVEVNNEIRSYKNGWVFCRENIVVTDELFDLAKEAVSVLFLDFGAVDIIYSTKLNQYFVLEVNTAPGLEGQTINNYVEYFKNYVKNN